MADIKIGDRVRIDRPEAAYGPEYRGRIGLLTDIDDSECCYRVNLADSDGPVVWAYDVTRVSEPRSIKVGDRVRIVVDIYDEGPTLHTGTPGTVDKLDFADDRYPYRVLPDGREVPIWVHDVEPLIEEAPAEAVSDISVADLTRADFLRQARELLDGQSFTAHDLMALADDLQGKVR
ncbi:hypothetical protein ACFWFX_15460 [Streptomyces roseolus]|uniref:hypothetical protein n=1 Tax=Streptomyces roseolus TaxID=67358 RepID=UPI003649AD40